MNAAIRNGWTYRRRRSCKAPRRPLGFPGYPQPQPHPPVIPDKCGNAERKSGIQTSSAPQARSFPMEKVTEVRALLALMRWVPDRRAASLHLSGMGGAEERLRSPRSFRLPLSLQGSTLQSMPCLFDNRSFCVGLRQGVGWRQSRAMRSIQASSSWSVEPSIALQRGDLFTVPDARFSLVVRGCASPLPGLRRIPRRSLPAPAV